MNRQQCSTVNEQQCSTVNEQQCSTVNERKCNTVNKQQCSTVNEQQCSTVNERQCSTVNEQKCNTVNKQQCSTVMDRQCSTSYEQECRLVLGGSSYYLINLVMQCLCSLLILNVGDQILKNSILLLAQAMRMSAQLQPDKSATQSRKGNVTLLMNRSVKLSTNKSAPL